MRAVIGPVDPPPPPSGRVASADGADQGGENLPADEPLELGAQTGHAVVWSDWSRMGAQAGQLDSLASRVALAGPDTRVIAQVAALFPGQTGRAERQSV
ncbi:hypothetical protein Pen02_10620 [Plantactinospora endophytica]|uniref:Uncharacterized protein n=1 Tax=Plantactinospora endophytica TaxID=673535 RepID=A0ABQ4DUK4_9ACTN|nr:hypothetical protein Pen02_10620 [Plantactinospora endophytica]